MNFYLEPRKGKDGKHAIVIRGRDSFGKQYRIFLTSVFKEARIKAENWRQRIETSKGEAKKIDDPRKHVIGNPTLGYTLKDIKTAVEARVMHYRVVNPAYSVPDAWQELYQAPLTKSGGKNFPEKIVQAIPIYQEFYKAKKAHEYLRILSQLKADLTGWNKDIVFSKLTDLALEDFKSYLMGDGRRESERRIDTRGRIRQPKPLEMATIYSRFKYLRQVAKLAQKHGLVVDTSIFDFTVSYTTRSGGFALTYPEIMKIVHYKTDNPTRALARDYFLLEATTGIRNSQLRDLKNARLHPEYIEYIDSKNGDQLKTATRHQLNDIILRKYYKKNEPNDFLMPHLAQATVNVELKFIARELKLDRLIPYRGGLEPIYRHLSTHDGRHTYSTLLNQLAIPPDYIKEEMGHSQGITFGVYTHRYDRYDVIRKAVNSLPVKLTEETRIRELRKAV